MYSKDSSNEHIVIPLSEVVVYPETRTKVLVGKTVGEGLINAIKSYGLASAVGLTAKVDTEPERDPAGAFYTVGTLLSISRVQPADEGYIVFAHATSRVRAVALSEIGGVYHVSCEPLPDTDDLDEEGREEMLRDVRAAIHEISSNFQGSEQFTRPVDGMESVDQIMAFVMPFMPVDVATKQSLLETVSVKERYNAFLRLLVDFNERLNLRIEVARKATEKVGKANREALLREQLRVIQEELSEGEGSAGDGDYRERIERSAMPDEVRKKALSELKKLEMGGSQHHESQGIRNYLDLLLDLPWTVEETKEIDIVEARRVLDSNHNGLEKVKERIVQHLAVMKLKQEKQGSILLLVGPPGTGKTSLGRSIAEALGRKYVRISLGGVRDEAEIRGHRRTYVGALPGRIIQGIRRAGTKNPVFVLDEIDKVGSSYLGDPASALLEVLDPEQNSTFSDHYLEVSYDLSDVFFITTANTLSTIPAPLLDRMEVIRLSGYTQEEKTEIAHRYLLPRQIKENGIKATDIKLDDKMLARLITHYTREAGLRNLEREIGSVCRKVARKVAEGRKEPYTINARTLSQFLGPPKFLPEAECEMIDQPGMATGLAWTEAGGEILYIEVAIVKGRGNITLTGQLGDVMKESAQAAVSFCRSRLKSLKLKENYFDTIDIHVHVPAGAIPKDGPSAGVTIATAIFSALTKKIVRCDVAMTGEITLRGRVLPIGGLKEKALAALRAGITTVVIPDQNEKDLVEIPKDLRAKIKFVPVKHMDQILELIFRS